MHDYERSTMVDNKGETWNLALINLAIGYVVQAGAVLTPNLGMSTAYRLVIIW